MNRLECIKSMVDKCDVAADIGTDHGYVPEMLLRENICKKIIATDINQGPLTRAIEHLTKMNLDKMCDFRLGSGIEVLKEYEAQAIIVAGMGGDLITRMLKCSVNIALSAQQLILQPMTAIKSLRKFLYENGFIIIDENIVKELHHYYFVIKAQPGEAEDADDFYHEFSKILIEKKNPLMFEFLRKQISTNENIINNLEKSKNGEYNVKIEILKKKNIKIKELM